MATARITRTTRVQMTAETLADIEQWCQLVRSAGHGGAAKLVEPVTLTVEKED